MRNKRVQTVLLRQCRKQRQGLALVAVLWIVALLGCLAMVMLSVAQGSYREVHADLKRVQAEALADGGVFLVISMLCDEKLRKDIRIDGHEWDIRIADQNVIVSVQDERGKLDLNFAPIELIHSLMLQENIPNSVVSQIVEFIKTRREEAVTRSSPMYKSHQGGRLPIQAVSELKSVPGMTDEYFDRVEHFLTIYSQESDVYVAVAPSNVLRILPGMNTERVNETMAAREVSQITAGHLMKANSEGRGAFGIYAISAESKLEDVSFIRASVVMVSCGIYDPYKILEWKISYK